LCAQRERGFFGLLGHEKAQEGAKKGNWCVMSDERLVAFGTYRDGFLAFLVVFHSPVAEATSPGC
jgi:hypothetical protein